MTPQETLSEIIKNLGLPAGGAISIIIATFWALLKTWWWLPLPFLLWRPFLFFWLWWRQEVWDQKQKRIVLEIQMPKEVLKPIKAMENVFHGFWAIYDAPNWKEKWFQGKYLLSLSCEIASINGESHFYVRTPASLKTLMESSIYSQYPEAEIFEVPDYTKNIPLDVPNNDWNLWGADYKQFKDDIYPIRTYKEFEENPEAKEEKRIDPIASLLEGMSSLQNGEQIWVQIIAKAVSPEENDWIERAKKVINRLVKRPEPPRARPLIQEAADVVLRGKPAGGLERKEEEVNKMLYPEMMLTPGEREIVFGIENKIKKFSFVSNIRFIYLGKTDIFFKPNIKVPIGFFNQFSTLNLNGLKPWKKTATKANYLFAKRRVYLRKKKLFRRYVSRETPLFPASGGTFILNTEELASLFHFPGWTVAPAPTVPRVEAKKGEAPPGLPTE